MEKQNQWSHYRLGNYILGNIGIIGNKYITFIGIKIKPDNNVVFNVFNVLLLLTNLFITKGFFYVLVLRLSKLKQDTKKYRLHFSNIKII